MVPVLPEGGVGELGTHNPRPAELSPNSRREKDRVRGTSHNHAGQR